jgi:hypothetical protein
MYKDVETRMICVGEKKSATSTMKLEGFGWEWIMELTGGDHNNSEFAQRS